MSYTHLLFDADGTLYDFEASEEFAMTQTWKEYSIDLNEENIAAYRKRNHEAWTQFEAGTISIETLQTQRFQKFFDDMSIKQDAAEVGARFLTHLGSKSVLYPKSLPLLQELKKRGYKIYIVTNGIHSVQMSRIVREDTKDIYDGVFTPHMLGHWKPRKECFFSLLDKVGLSEKERSKAVVIGDRLGSDIIGGINAGLDTIWFNEMNSAANPQIVPTHEIADIDDLLKLLPPLT